MTDHTARTSMHRIQARGDPDDGAAGQERDVVNDPPQLRKSAYHVLTTKTLTRHQQRKNPMKTRSMTSILALCIAIVLSVSSADAALVTTNLIQHLDSDTNVNATGSNINFWDPVSGVGDTVTTNSNSPQLITNALNGRDIVSLTSDRLAGSDPNLFDLGTGSFTWFLVARPASQGGPGAHRFFGTLEGGGSYRGIMGTVTGDERIVSEVRTAGGGTPAGAADPLSTINQWHIWTATRTGATNSLYRDGLLVATVGTAAGDIQSGPLTIGAERTGGAEYVDGDMAALLVYNTQLNPQQINDTGYFLAERFGLETAFTAPPVPEPSTFALGILAIAGLAACRWRKIAGHRRIAACCLVAALMIASGTPGHATNLRGYYALDNNYLDSSASGANGTPNGTLGFSTTAFRGTHSLDKTLGNAGSGNYVSAPIDINKGPAPGTTFSFGAWIRPSAVAFDGFLSHDNGSWDRGMMTNGGAWRLASGGPTDGGTAATGAWQFVTGTFDGTTAAMYYGNDVAATQTTGSHSRLDTEGAGHTDFRIGQYGGAGYTGLIDEVFVFQDPLDTFFVNSIRNMSLSSLQYNPAEMDQLFDLFQAGSGTASIGGTTWEHTTGLSTTNPGEVFDLGGGQLAVVLDASGNGLQIQQTVPEPSTFALGILTIAGLAACRGRKIACNRRIATCCLVAALALFTLPNTSNAAIFVYEGFNYGGSDLGSLSGLGGGGSVGFGANTWALGLGATDTSGYKAAGLTFSNLDVVGGVGTMSSPAFTVAGRRTFSRQLGITQTGTVWGSFLFRTTDVGQPGAAVIVDNTAGPFDQGGHFHASTTRDATAIGKILMNDNASNVNNSGTNISPNTTYLHLFKMTNLGAASTTHTMDNWILTEAQFDNFKGGGLTEAELNAATLGTGATQVQQRATLNSGTFVATMTTTDFLALNAVGSTTAPFEFDEIRFSNVDLNEVVPLASSGGGAVPEPSTFALGILAIAGLAACRWRRTGRRV
jgi:hypothetical protein